MRQRKVECDLLSSMLYALARKDYRRPGGDWSPREIREAKTDVLWEMAYDAAMARYDAWCAEHPEEAAEFHYGCTLPPSFDILSGRAATAALL